MPFEKPSAAVGERGGGRALLLAAALLFTALLLLRAGSLQAEPSEEAGPLHAVVENEAVRVFLGLDEVE